MKTRIAPYVENVCESGISCLLTMVQGNVLALTLSHWVVASQTGLLSGAIAATAIIAAKFRKPWLISLTLGLITVAGDAFVHRATFGVASLIEAVVTGVGAFVLSLAASRVVSALSKSRFQRLQADARPDRSGA